ncbi:MAG: hypothetical protein ABI946_05080 [Chthoniobacterales bacterium]
MEAKPTASPNTKRFLVWLLLPIVCAWARRHEAEILRRGSRLSARGLEEALRAGVQAPHRVRTLTVECIPPRLPFWLRRITASWSWGPATTAGMSLGYGIFLRTDQVGRRDLLLHELVHTAQYERLGFRPFLRAYLLECLSAGYPRGTLETEAREVASETR